jgi:hypothetical protein
MEKELPWGFKTKMNIEDVWNAVRDVKIQGGHAGDIEAFVIHPDDLHALYIENDNMDNPCIPRQMTNYDGPKILGISIIESPYVPKGTIFKIMKNDQKQYAHPIDEMGNLVMPNQHYSPTMPGSGTIPGWKNPGITEVGPICGLKKPDYLPTDPSQKTVDDKLKSHDKKEDRHSDVRKIKLD